MTTTSMLPSSLPLTQSQSDSKRQEQAIRRAVGLLKSGKPTNALGVLEKALNDCKDACTD